MTILARDDWRQRAAEHTAAVDELTQGHRARRRTGERHPVEDFLFEYYGHKPSQLRRWHPGVGTALRDAAHPFASWSGYVVDPDGTARVDLPAVLARRGRTLAFVRDLLEATRSRPPHLGCFGLHEWAMVYRLAPGERRHEQLPLRLGRARTDAVLERHPVRCSHADAYRFFTEPARPRNLLAPTRESQVEHEQPGCLHAGMDLYKWCFTLAPLTPSELTLDAFVLAREIRDLDMAASPYDVSSLGIEPVPVETAAGKAVYLERQREFAVRGDALRRRLLEVVDGAVGGGAVSDGAVGADAGAGGTRRD